MFNIGSQELIVILIIALIVVGPQRLPELSRSIGKGLREFRKVQDEVKDMVKLDLGPEPATPTRRPASPTAPGVHRTPKPATTPETSPAVVPSVDATSPAAPPPEDAGQGLSAQDPPSVPVDDPATSG
jgi:Tat protein translocase TatB subunit